MVGPRASREHSPRPPPAWDRVPRSRTCILRHGHANLPPKPLALTPCPIQVSTAAQWTARKSFGAVSFNKKVPHPHHDLHYRGTSLMRKRTLPGTTLGPWA